MQTKKAIARLTLCAMMMALSILIGAFCKAYLTIVPPAIRITFENLPVILAAMLFGPIVGGAVGAGSDLIASVISAQSSINPMLMVGACMVGVSAGVIARIIPGELRPFKITVSIFAGHIIGSMLIKSIALHVYFGVAWAMLIWRIPLYIGIAACESVLLGIILSNREIKKQIERLM